MSTSMAGSEGMAMGGTMGGAWVETGVGVTCVRVSVAGVAEVSLGGREVGREALEEGKVEVGVLIALVDERLVDFAALVVLALDEEESASFFVRVGAAPVLLLVVVTAPLLDKALLSDLTKTVGSLVSFGIPFTSRSMSR